MTERTFVNMAANGLLQEFKRHIRMTSDDLDAELYQKMLAAVQHAEHHIGKVILRSEFVVESTFSNTLSLKVPNPMIESLEVDGVETSDFTLEGKTLKINGTGTTLRLTYEAGYECIPWDMKAAILMHAASLFNNPTDSVETLAKASQNLLRPYRSWGLDDGEQV